MKCKICDSGRADEINGLLASGLSLTKIGAKTGFGRVVVWRHGKHSRESETGGATAADRELLRAWRALYKKSLRDGALDTAARALGAIAELQGKIATPSPQAKKKQDDANDQRPWCRLMWSDPAGNRTNLSEDEFLGWILRARGWRTPLTATLTMMLGDAATPATVRAAAAEFLAVLSEEDTDDRLGVLENANDEAEEADDASADTDDAA